MAEPPHLNWCTITMKYKNKNNMLYIFLVICPQKIIGILL